ncbi:MAG: aldolase/citrate lyase family protein [Candidatus Zapsychrus exili]|nr:aldolase/citrate lyase family protein [Candidatus Zapsychrus exili]
MKELIRRRLALRKKFKERSKIFGAWTSIAHPSITEMFCKAPFDFVGIDIEHSTISQEQSQRIIAAAQSEGSLCLPRIASHNMEMIKRLLDSGADGIIVPMVETKEEVKKIIEWSKYTPVGKRSYGIARAQGYGFDFDKYSKSWNDSSVIIVQIESVKGVENIDEILSFKEIDAVMIGPYDLSSSLGVPGQIGHKRVKDMCGVVINSCKKYKKACGTQNTEPDIKSIKSNFIEGFNFVVLASDIFVLWEWTEKIKNCIESLGKSK